MQETLRRIARELSLPVEVVSKAYSAYWLFIREHIEELPLKEELTEEEFKRLRVNFNLPNLGKLGCSRERWLGIKKKHKLLTHDT